MKNKDFLSRGVQAKRESKYIEFKSEFDTTSRQSWCEIIKDIVAMANSGGGVILIGLDNSGKPIAQDVSAVLALDPSDVTNKVRKYTGYEFTEFEIENCQKDGSDLAAIVVSQTPVPIPFSKPGTYPVDTTSQKTAFAQGSVYFRHGAKSEPANRDDFSKWVGHRLYEERTEWLKRVRRVVRAPLDAEITIQSGPMHQASDSTTQSIRIVDDPDAPKYQMINPDDAYPYRQKELIERLKELLMQDVRITSHTILTINLMHKTRDQPKWTYRSKYGSCQYNETYAQWITEQHKADPEFFKKAHDQWYKRQYK